MTAFSTYFRDAQLAWIKGTTFPTPPANLYLAFYSSDPGRAGTSGTDITTSIVAAGRVAVASSAWAAITANGNARQISNTAGISLGNAVSSISATHIGVWDASSGGNFIGGASSPFTTVSGQPYTIAANALVIELP
jgi:hypothetical protein